VFSDKPHFVYIRSMKKTMLFILLVCVVLFRPAHARAQMILATATDSVQIFSQWGKEKPLKKSSPKVLLLRVENSNPQPVEVSFEVNFIDELKVVETSNVQKVQIAAAKSGKPKKVKLKFKPAKYNPDEVDGVDVEILEVNK
jgi:LEA14-like dessication related protein